VPTSGEVNATVPTFDDAGHVAGRPEPRANAASGQALTPPAREPTVGDSSTPSGSTTTARRTAAWALGRSLDGSVISAATEDGASARAGSAVTFRPGANGTPAQSVGVKPAWPDPDAPVTARARTRVVAGEQAVGFVRNALPPTRPRSVSARRLICTGMPATLLGMSRTSVLSP
jgi:hypothetical protein